jgi:hypothetical protein
VRGFGEPNMESCRSDLRIRLIRGGIFLNTESSEILRR